MRAPIAVIVCCLFAFLVGRSAGATVSVTLGSSDPDAHYLPGETITLTVHVTANGGETDSTVFGAIEYGAQVVPGTREQVSLPPGDWILGDETCAPHAPWCAVFSALHVIDIQDVPVAINATDFALTTATFIVNSDAPAGSVVQFNWRTSPSTQRFDFFGLTNAAGYSVTIAPVPEPGTAALLGMGLPGLALASRRAAFRQ
jgi:hypothetical protein